MEPVKGTLLGNRAFADVINSTWDPIGLGRTLNSRPGVFIKERLKTPRRDGRTHKDGSRN